MSPKRVTVHWRDASTFHGWRSLKDLPECPICTTSGYLMKRTKRTVWIAATYCNDGDDDQCFNDVMPIPAGAVVRIEIL